MFHQKERSLQLIRAARRETRVWNLILSSSSPMTIIESQWACSSIRASSTLTGVGSHRAVHEVALVAAGVEHATPLLPDDRVHSQRGTIGCSRENNQCTGAQCAELTLTFDKKAVYRQYFPISRLLAKCCGYRHGYALLSPWPLYESPTTGVRPP